MVSSKWSAAFVEYFQSHLEVAVKKSATFSLRKLGLGISEITNNPAESFNATLKRMLDWKQVRLEKMLFSEFQLTKYYLNEILRGHCNIGNYHLQSNKTASKLEHVNFPEDVLTLEEICCFNQDKVTEAEKQEQKEVEEQTITSRQSMAKLLIEKKKISLDINTKCFIVTGWRGQRYVVTLAPKEHCSCNTTTQCCHIMAAQMAVGFDVKPKKRNIFSLRQLTRRVSRKRSGVKGSTAEVLPAPDSKAARKGLPEEEMKKPADNDNVRCH